VPGVLRDLVTNLASGARLALMLPVGRDDFRRSRDQAVLVIGVWLSTILVIDYVSVDPVREFNSYAVGYFGARLLSVLLGTYLIARIQGASHSCAALVIYIVSASPIAWIVSENDRLGYFPQAFFDVSLRSEFSFTAAFKGAVTQVSQREQREGKTPSEPQIYEGAHIGTQLRRLEDRLRSPAAQAAVNGTGPAAPASGL
jgi:hypothetical protein